MSKNSRARTRNGGGTEPVTGTETETAKRDDPLGRVLGYCVAVVAILGIPSGLYGYYAGEHAKRVQTTFEFYKDFRTDNFQKKYQAMTNRADAKADIIKGLMDKYRGNPEERDRQVLEAVKGLIATEDGLKNTSEVLLFFDVLATCVNTSLCDRNAAVTLFKLPALEFASAYGPYIMHIRYAYGNETFGTGLFQTRAMETEWSIF